jgi:hypothetical protein
MVVSVPRRALFILAAMGVVAPIAIRVLASHRASKVASDLCLWLNAPSSDRAALRMGPQTEATLEGLRGRGAPIVCTTGYSPYADNILTETAIILRPSSGAAIGLRVSPLSSVPVILGHWTL